MCVSACGSSVRWLWNAHARPRDVVTWDPWSTPTQVSPRQRTILGRASVAGLLHSIQQAAPPVVVKVDIDDPRLEWAMARAVVEQHPPRVAEFYFEHHTRVPEMLDAWGNGSSLGELTDTYALMLAGRHKGIRTHAWV